MRAPLLIALCVASWPLASSAQQVRVAIVTAGEEALPLAQRLEAELSSLSFVPLPVVHDNADPSEQELVELAGQLEATAFLVVRPGLTVIDLWTLELGGARAERRGTVAEPEEHRSISALAIRATESLRALLIEVEPPPPPPAVEASVSESGLTTPRVDEGRLSFGWSHRRLELGLGLGLQWSPGGVGASGQVLVDLGYTPRRWLGVHLLGVAPMVPAVVEGQEGTAKVRAGLVGGGLRFSLMSASSRVGGELDLGVAAVVLSLVGEANAPYTSLSDRVWSAAPYLRPRLVVRLTSWLRLGLDLLVGLSASAVIVRFASRDAASWGHPFLLAGVSLVGAFL